MYSIFLSRREMWGTTSGSRSSTETGHCLVQRSGRTWGFHYWGKFRYKSQLEDNLRKKKPLNHSGAGTTKPVRRSGRVQTVAMLGESTTTTTCIGESSFYSKSSTLACFSKLLNMSFMVSNSFTSVPSIHAYIWWYLITLSGLKADSDQQRAPGLWTLVFSWVKWW